MKHYPSIYPRHGCVVSLDDRATIRQYVLNGAIWTLPCQFWQKAFDAVRDGVVTEDEMLSKAPAKIRAHFEAGGSKEA